MASNQELVLRLSWRGRVAKIGLDVAVLAARCHMASLSTAIVKACVLTLMREDVWVVCRS